MASLPVPVTELLTGVVALYLLVRGASEAIERTTALARRYDVPDALIALSVIAVGTSLPEIGAHVTGSLGILSGDLDYVTTSAAVLGGNMGSSTLQQLLLVGIFLIGYGRTEFSWPLIRESYLPMVGAFVLALVVTWNGTITRLEGIALLVVFVAYIADRYRRRSRGLEPEEPPSEHVLVDAGIAVVALAIVVLGAFVVLALIQSLVASLRLGGSTVGVVSIGVAAALPELSTVVEALRQRQPEVALGTLFGTNVVNLLVAMGGGAAISTYRVPGVVLAWDLPFKLTIGVGLLAYLRFVSEGVVGRREGGYLVILYLVYVGGRLVLYAGQ